MVLPPNYSEVCLDKTTVPFVYLKVTLRHLYHAQEHKVPRQLYS